jgi:hypothetical protein
VTDFFANFVQNDEMFLLCGDTTLPVFKIWVIASNGRMIGVETIENNLNASDSGLIEVLLRHLTGTTEENYEEPQSG